MSEDVFDCPAPYMQLALAPNGKSPTTEIHHCTENSSKVDLVEAISAKVDQNKQLPQWQLFIFLNICVLLPLSRFLS